MSDTTKKTDIVFVYVFYIFNKHSYPLKQLIKQNPKTEQHFGKKTTSDHGNGGTTLLDCKWTVSVLHFTLKVYFKYSPVHHLTSTLLDSSFQRETEEVIAIFALFTATRFLRQKQSFYVRHVSCMSTVPWLVSMFVLLCMFIA